MTFFTQFQDFFPATSAESKKVSPKKLIKTFDLTKRVLRSHASGELIKSEFMAVLASIDDEFICRHMLDS